MMVIYKTTNLKNGKYYIGKQKSYTDSYFGSGTALKFAIKKYGKENFKKEILEFFPTKKEAFDDQEKYIVKYKFQMDII